MTEQLTHTCTHTHTHTMAIQILKLILFKVKSESENNSVVSDSLRPHGLYSPWNSLGWNTRVGSLFLLQGIFPTQGLNTCLPYSGWMLYQLSHKGSPILFRYLHLTKILVLIALMLQMG